MDPFTDIFTEMQVSYLDRAIIRLTNALYDQSCFDLMSKEEMRDALSSGQLISKKWLIDTLRETNFTPMKAVVVGGWVGLIASALNEQKGQYVADSLDIDSKAAHIATHVLQGSLGKSILGDMYDFNYKDYGLVINTSMEHIGDTASWIDLIDAGTLIVAQSNNARHVPDHVNCVDSAEELERSLNLSETLYAGELIFPMYTRYMVIGRR